MNLRDKIIYAPRYWKDFDEIIFFIFDQVWDNVRSPITEQMLNNIIIHHRMAVLFEILASQNVLVEH